MLGCSFLKSTLQGLVVLIISHLLLEGLGWPKCTCGLKKGRRPTVDLWRMALSTRCLLVGFCDAICLCFCRPGLGLYEFWFVPILPGVFGLGCASSWSILPSESRNRSVMSKPEVPALPLQRAAFCWWRRRNEGFLGHSVLDKRRRRERKLLQQGQDGWGDVKCIVGRMHAGGIGWVLAECVYVVEWWWRMGQWASLVPISVALVWVKGCVCCICCLVWAG